MEQSALVLIAAAFILTLSIAGVGFALFAPNLNGGGRTTKRLKTVKNREFQSATGKAQSDRGKDRRKHVEETLAKIEERQQAAKRKVSLNTKIERAGLAISSSTFYIISAIFGVIAAIASFFLIHNPLIAVAIGFSATLGVPQWALSFLAKRRQAAFMNEFAGSIDVIVRGIETGLPLNDCLQIIASEASAPVGPEFERVVEAGRIGIPVGEALEMMTERIPIPELNFFAIVLAIQSKTGGNLSEALRNLSTVLRSRKLMKAKIQALSSEAKASALILGLLPPSVMGAVYATNKEYIMLLFTHPMGNMLLIAGAFWMTLGILIMRKMINFKF